jgi:cbb3-type cytochrome c oxidase subunit I
MSAEKRVDLEEKLDRELDRDLQSDGPPPHSAAKGFIVSGAIWLIVGTTWGFIGALEYVAPDLIQNVSWLSFGRVRTAHLNIVAFGFLTATLIGVALYCIPALLRTKLFSERLGVATMWAWNAAVLIGAVTISMGYTQAREYAELEWPIDVAVLLAFVLILYNMIMTVVFRREKNLYVSVWYFVGAILWTSMVYPLGNVMWHPKTGSMTGTVDAIWLWFYGHNVIGLLFTPLAVGAAYYVIPRVARAPLYSHTLSIIGFWTLGLIYTHIGTHHLMQAPVPLWLKVIAGIDSFLMLIPVFTVLVNLWMTARGHWVNFFGTAAGKFVFAGTIWYAVVCIQGAFHSLNFVQRVTHFNNWVVGHAHIAVFGFAGMIAIGAAYHILPKVCGRKIWSPPLANLQYWLIFLGLWGMFIALTIGGLVQGNSWLNGESVYRVLPQLTMYSALRVMFATMIIVGALVGAYNILMTVSRGERIEPA